MLRVKQTFDPIIYLTILEIHTNWEYIKEQKIAIYVNCTTTWITHQSKKMCHLKFFFVKEHFSFPLCFNFNSTKERFSRGFVWKICNKAQRAKPLGIKYRLHVVPASKVFELIDWPLWILHFSIPWDLIGISFFDKLRLKYL